MGVTNLWPVLEPVQVHHTLSSLKGQTLAVDLSIWVCETQCVRQMQGVVSKPYLRNLFFRISHLLQLGVHLVFVIEGSAPELKQQVMAKRQESRYPHKKVVGGQRKGGRRNFNACLKECCEMLDYLGVPYVQSPGEAEATCAALNANGVVDGCLTNDGDAFLYGAQTVYRNFTMNTKDPHVECYSMKDVEERLRLTREKLVAMALLLGCDYLPKGVPGVGVERAVKLMNSLPSCNILERFEKWSSMLETACVDPVEIFVRRKALQVPDFPQKEVINEFLQEKNKCPKYVLQWRRPVMANLQVFCLNKLEWPLEYTVEKILPLITLWDMYDIIASMPRNDCHLVPKQILKARVRCGVQCYEVLWNPPEAEAAREDQYKTIEEQALFRKSFPLIAEEFDKEQASKKSKSRGKSKKKTTEKMKETEEIKCEKITDVIIGGEDLEDDDNNADDEEQTKTAPVAKSLLPMGHLKQQMMVSPMHRLELAMKSLQKSTETNSQVAVERNLNFSSSEEEEEEEEDYLPLSQRLQNKIARPRAGQKGVRRSPVSSPSGKGDEGINEMVRAITQGVSGALRSRFSSESDSDDLQTFPTQTETRTDHVYTEQDSKCDSVKILSDRGRDFDGSYQLCKQVSNDAVSSDSNDAKVSGGSLQKTPMWQRYSLNSKKSIEDKAQHHDSSISDLNFSVLTPDVLVRSMPCVASGTGTSASTPDGQRVDTMAKFSQNMSNLSPHLSENIMISPLPRDQSMESPAILASSEKPKTYQNISAMWENVSLNKTSGGIEFGDFEVQTSLLNSFSNLNITDKDMSTVIKVVPPSPEKETDKNVSKAKSVITEDSEEDSVIVLNGFDSGHDSVSNSCEVKGSQENVSDSHSKQDNLILRSVLRTVNRQGQMYPKPTKNRSYNLSETSSSCVGKENDKSDKWEVCSGHSPLSLIDRLKQRLDNPGDSSLISNIRPLSVKPVSHHQDLIKN